MKKNTLKAILIILIIVLLSLVSFGGIYVKNLNSMKNVVKDYNYGMDFTKKMLISLKVQEETEESENTEEQETEESVVENVEETENTENTQETTENSESISPITKDNVNTAKDVIRKRLEAIGVKEYYIRANYGDGTIVLELPESTDTNYINDIAAVGKFTIEDSDGNVLGGTDVIDNVDYKLDRTSYAVPCVKIDIKFKKAFIKNLLDTQNNYVASVDEEGNVVEKKISLKIDGSDIYSDAANDFIEDAKINNCLSLFLGQTDSTEEELQQYYKSAAVISTLLENEKNPLKYEVATTDIVNSNLTINSVIIVGLVALGLLTIWAIYKYKLKGVVAIISLIGYVALMLLLIRYTNAIIAFEGVFALALIFGMEYLFNLKLISNSLNSKEKMIKIYSKTLMQFLNVIVVSFIISVVFLMQTWVPIASFGTILFWGIVIMIAYNYLVTKNLIESIKNK